MHRALILAALAGARTAAADPTPDAPPVSVPDAPHADGGGDADAPGMDADAPPGKSFHGPFQTSRLFSMPVADVVGAYMVSLSGDGSLLQDPGVLTSAGVLAIGFGDIAQLEYRHSEAISVTGVDAPLPAVGVQLKLPIPEHTGVPAFGIAFRLGVPREEQDGATTVTEKVTDLYLVGRLRVPFASWLTLHGGVRVSPSHIEVANDAACPGTCTVDKTLYLPTGGYEIQMNAEARIVGEIALAPQFNRPVGAGSPTIDYAAIGRFGLRWSVLPSSRSTRASVTRSIPILTTRSRHPVGCETSCRNGTSGSAPRCSCPGARWLAAPSGRFAKSAASTRKAHHETVVFDLDDNGGARRLGRARERTTGAARWQRAAARRSVRAAAGRDGERRRAGRAADHAGSADRAGAAEDSDMISNPPVDATSPPPAAKKPDPSINMPELLRSPTGWLLPAAVLYSKTAIDTGGGVSSTARVGLGDVAEFGVTTTDDVRGATKLPTDNRIQPYALATFRMGVGENRLFQGQPAIALGFDKSFERDDDGFKTRIAQLTLVASKHLGQHAAIHVGGALWDASLDADGGGVSQTLNQEGLGQQIRPFGGFEISPIEKSEILVDLSWAPQFCYGCTGNDQIQLRPELSWGVRYEVADWMRLESGVRVPDIGNANLLNAQIFGSVTFTSWALHHVVNSLK